MQPFLRLEAVALPLPASDVNTDQIIPARFLRKQRAGGFGQYLFHDVRFDDHERERPEFVLNQTPYRGAKILVAGPNFGCGSSREMAVWALADYGVRALIASRFADIFYNNCFRNGVLPVVLPEEAVHALLELLRQTPGSMVQVDLESQQVTAGPHHCRHRYRFEIDAFNKKCLLQGIDEIGYTLGFADQIAAYERREVAAP
ncbi:3-isopropylmalate dehydratase small subunit [Burkholderia sp. L27(2015)]|uniref:3-isopropylmalate dehydratase small subunit n=1 Tax=Burkholderia sp. L27(2015) TaxID=1641858 RepID=UPI00131D6B39|nr:3-isopropylmalate dehydratase small subunit [Burkholderia sp. L27(2015)]